MYFFHFTNFACSLSLLVLTTLHLRAPAYSVLQKGGRAQGFAAIRGLGTGFSRGLGWGLNRGGVGGALGHPPPSGLLEGQLCAGAGGPTWLEAWCQALQAWEAQQAGHRPIWGWASFWVCSLQQQPFAAPNGSLLQHDMHTTDASQPETSHVPLRAYSPFLNNKGHKPRVDTIGEGHKCLCTKQVVRCNIPLQSAGFLTPLFLLPLLPPLYLLPLSQGSVWSDDDQLLDYKDLGMPLGPFFGLLAWGGGR